jgi:hypothetical protein
MSEPLRYEFKDESQFRIFKTALRERMMAAREREAGEAEQPAHDESFDTILSPMFDRCQRKWNGHSDGEPLYYEFTSQDTLFVAAVSVLWYAHLGERADSHVEYDTTPAVTRASGLATRLNALHPENPLAEVSFDE